jgi:hypothetical protein
MVESPSTSKIKQKLMVSPVFIPFTLVWLILNINIYTLSNVTNVTMFRIWVWTLNPSQFNCAPTRHQVILWPLHCSPFKFLAQILCNFDIVHRYDGLNMGCGNWSCSWLGVPSCNSNMGFFFTSNVKYSKVFFFVLENTSQHGRHIFHSTFW